MIAGVFLLPELGEAAEGLSFIIFPNRRGSY